MTEKEYRAHPAISRSELAKMSESPEKFRWYRDHPGEPTPALLFGQLFHAMALQPEAVDQEFAVAPMVDRRTKAGKEVLAAFEQGNADKTIVTAEMYQQATEMTEALYRNGYAKRLLQGDKETPFFWTDDITGEECKCRTDCLIETDKNLVIVDLKTTDNAETEAFTRSMIKYQYDLQVAMYSEGVKANTGRQPIFVFIAIEKKPPYAVNILQCDELIYRRGYDLFREYLGIYHSCKETGEWWGYTGAFNQINTITLPPYLKERVE